ncbi:hypothetical protein [Atrimonas thermophila]|jgi:hypothetical protein|uniref:hypothetical protein n=1 Tax=Atrimonas thermophila TaxID=3064161 RepID=UPI00399C9DE2
MRKEVEETLLSWAEKIKRGILTSCALAFFGFYNTSFWGVGGDLDGVVIRRPFALSGNGRNTLTL